MLTVKEARCHLKRVDPGRETVILHRARWTLELVTEMHCCLTHGSETLMGCRFRASCSQLPQLTHVAIPAHHGCVCHSQPLSLASLQEIRLGVVMTAACHGRKNWIEPHEINLSNLFVSHKMGCVSPFTAFPTREGYVMFQCFGPGREWGNHQLLSLPSEEGEGEDSPLSAPWCETGVYREWGKCTNRLSNTSNLQSGRGRKVAEFALTQASLHLLAPRRS